MINFKFVQTLVKRETDINEHLLMLYTLVFVTGAKIVVELGAGQSTYALLAAVNATDGELYSIDVGEDPVYRDFEQGKTILSYETKLHLIKGDDMEVFKTWGKEIDFLFIDTSHRYDETTVELEKWTKWVKQNGVIAMHDTQTDDPLSVGCRIALDEFLEKNKSYKAIHFPNRNGLSVIKKYE